MGATDSAHSASSGTAGKGAGKGKGKCKEAMPPPPRKEEISAFLEQRQLKTIPSSSPPVAVVRPPRIAALSYIRAADLLTAKNRVKNRTSLDKSAGKPDLWQGLQCVSLQSADGSFEASLVSEKLNQLYQDICCDSPTDFYDPLSKLGNRVCTAFVLKIYEKLLHFVTTQNDDVVDRTYSFDLQKLSGAERTDSLRRQVVSHHKPICDEQWLECAEQWLESQASLEGDVADAAAFLVDAWFQEAKKRSLGSNARRVSHDERAKREEERQQRNEAARMEEARRVSHWRSVSSRSVHNVPWHDVKTTMWCSGGMGGAVLVQLGEVSPQAVVVKPQAMFAVAEAFAQEVAQLIGVRVAESRMVFSSQDEFLSLATALRSSMPMCEEHMQYVKRITSRSKDCVAVVEFVQGCILQGVDGQMALQGSMSSQILHELGSLIVLDCLLNNLDRIPAIWKNDGNLGNVMIENGHVVGIDQQVHPIMNSDGHERYLLALQSFCSNVRDGRSDTPSVSRIKTSFFQNCGVLLDEDACSRLLAGCCQTFSVVAAESDLILAALPKVGNTLTGLFKHASVDLGTSHLDSMIAFVTSCVEVVVRQWSSKSSSSD